MELLELLRPYTSFCFADMCKNAGKTTLLKAILTEDDGRYGSMALSSIGRDGEQEDLVTGTKKPQLYVREGTLLATAQGLLSFCDCSLQLLEQTGFSTPLGEVYIARALTDGFVQLAGPSMASQLSLLKERFLLHGAGKVLFDGALFRKSLCSPKVSEGVFLSTGAAYSPSMEKTVEDTAFAVRLLSLPLSEHFKGPMDGCRQVFRGSCGSEPLDSLSSLPFTDAVYLEGAVTNKRLEPLLQRRGREPLELCVQDGSKLFISLPFFEKLLRKNIELRVLERNSPVALSWNPYAPSGMPYDRNAFKQALEQAVSLPLVDAESRQGCLQRGGAGHGLS